MCKQEKYIKSPDDFASISDYVAYIRDVRGYTLQEVEELVQTAINHNELPKHCSLTRSYLSCLEAGKYREPSPFKLQSLAYVYHISYESLLQKAKYLKKTDGKQQQDIMFTLMLKEVQDMTPEEQQTVLEYIDFVKSKRIKCCVNCQ